MVSAASLALNLAAVRLAFRFGFVAFPNAISDHGRPVALLGGPAVFLAAAPGLVYISTGLPQWNGFNHALLLVGVLGLFKDGGLIIPPLAQLAWQIAAGLILYLEGPSFGIGAGATMDGVVGVVLAVSAINGVNFLDVQDGLAGTTILITLASLSIMALVAGSGQLAALSALLGFAVVGFLVVNRPPARIFLGDAGSFGLGVATFAIAAALSGFLGDRGWVAFLPLSLPFAELVATMVVRVAARRSPMIGDGRHVSTILRAYLCSERLVLAIACSAALVSGALGICLTINAPR
jgi:UDP-GlcNAc:undecaprenyl-phosphate GlcNAc-1-phosphate transferase